jgi:hypothetical protein
VTSRPVPDCNQKRSVERRELSDGLTAAVIGACVTGVVGSGVAMYNAYKSRNSFERQTADTIAESARQHAETIARTDRQLDLMEQGQQAKGEGAALPKSSTLAPTVAKGQRPTPAKANPGTTVAGPTASGTKGQDAVAGQGPGPKGAAFRDESLAASKGKPQRTCSMKKRDGTAGSCGVSQIHGDARHRVSFTNAIQQGATPPPKAQPKASYAE